MDGKWDLVNPDGNVRCVVFCFEPKRAVGCVAGEGACWWWGY